MISHTINFWYTDTVKNEEETPVDDGLVIAEEEDAEDDEIEEIESH